LSTAVAEFASSPQLPNQSVINAIKKMLQTTNQVAKLVPTAASASDSQFQAHTFAIRITPFFETGSGLCFGFLAALCPGKTLSTSVPFLCFFVPG
jgi:hypothetical protein